MILVFVCLHLDGVLFIFHSFFFVATVFFICFLMNMLDISTATTGNMLTLTFQWLTVCRLWFDYILLCCVHTLAFYFCVCLILSPSSLCFRYGRIFILCHQETCRSTSLGLFVGKVFHSIHIYSSDCYVEVTHRIHYVDDWMQANKPTTVKCIISMMYICASYNDNVRMSNQSPVSFYMDLKQQQRKQCSDPRIVKIQERYFWNWFLFLVIYKL